MLDVAVHQFQVKYKLPNLDFIWKWCITVSKHILNHIIQIGMWTVFEYICNTLQDDFTVSWSSTDKSSCQLSIYLLDWHSLYWFSTLRKGYIENSDNLSMKQELLKLYVTIPNQNELHTTWKLWICSCIFISKLTWQERVKWKTAEVSKCYKRTCISKHNANYKYTTCTSRQHYCITLKLIKAESCGKIHVTNMDCSEAPEQNKNTQNQKWHNQKGADSLQVLNELEVKIWHCLRHVYKEHT
jgi:hypothetical protein